MKDQRVVSLDGLRGFAALAVVLYHFGFRFGALYPKFGEPYEVIKWGQYGVQLFFVISGFVILMTLERASLRSFVINRAIRLYPIYWVCLALTFAVVFFAQLPGRQVSVMDAMVNFSMLQGYVGVPHVDGAYWTLGAEISFYGQVGLLFAIGALSAARATPFLYLWVVFATVLSHLRDVVPAGGLDKVLGALSAGFLWIPLFIAGMALYRIWNGDRRVAMLALPVLAVVAIGSERISLGLASLLVILVFCLVLWGPSFGMASRPAIFLGAISFPLYLVHQNIGYVLIRLFMTIGLNRAGAIGLALAIIVGLASLLTFAVDVPLRRYLRNRFVPRQSAIAGRVQSTSPSETPPS